MKNLHRIKFLLTIFTMVSLVFVSCKNDNKDEDEKQTVSAKEAPLKYMEEMYDDDKGETLNYDILRGKIYSKYPNVVQAMVNINLSPSFIKVSGYDNSEAGTRAISAYTNWWQGVNFEAKKFNEHMETEDGAMSLLAYNLLKNNTSTTITRGWLSDTVDSVSNAVNSGVGAITSGAAEIIMAPYNGVANIVDSFMPDTLVEVNITNNLTSNITLQTVSAIQLKVGAMDTAIGTISENVIAMNTAMNTNFENAFKRMTNLDTGIENLQTDVSAIKSTLNQGFEDVSAQMNDISDQNEATQSLIESLQSDSMDQFSSLHQGQEALQEKLKEIDILINQNIGLSYTILTQVLADDLKDAKDKVAAFTRTISNFQYIDDSERVELIKEFITRKVEELITFAYRSATEAHDTRKEQGTFFDMDLLIPIRDMIFLREVSIMRLDLMTEIYSGYELIQIRSNVAQNDITRVQEMKTSIDEAIETSEFILDLQNDPQCQASEECQAYIVDYEMYLAAGFSAMASWEIVLQGHINAAN